MNGVAPARRLLARAIAERVFPAACLDVGDSAGSRWHEAAGTLTFDDGAPTAALETPFDLASLTKVVSTTSVVMALARTGRLGIEDPVSAGFEEWRGPDRAGVTVRDLLEHASGLSARLADLPPAGRREFEHEICRMPLEYRPRRRSLYSDVGFILLGFLAADRGGATLPVLFDQIWNGFAPGPASGRLRPDRLLTFHLDADARRRAAPTAPLPEDLRRGRMLVGEVHDPYAAALGGVAGHAGLFGTAPAVAAFARGVLRAARGEEDAPPPFSPDLVARFTTKSTVPKSSRALGWDTMLTTSSCGTRMSPAAFGHVGFTGTSLWIDPVRDRYFVLLTNRAAGGGSLEAMRVVRRDFHDALGDF